MLRNYTKFNDFDTLASKSDICFPPVAYIV